MDTTEEQRVSRGGISNFYYGGVTNVINLKLSRDQVAVLGSGTTLQRRLTAL